MAASMRSSLYSSYADEDSENTYPLCFRDDPAQKCDGEDGSSDYFEL